VIPEPQRAYVLELWGALGEAAHDFVLVGGQALKFALPEARVTRDFDFVLDVVSIRKSEVPVGKILTDLGYAVAPESRNFQFEKQIPASAHVMRVELLAPDELKRKSSIRIDVDSGVHARACLGGAIALAESDVHEVDGVLPTGLPACVSVRVIRPHALVLLKCLAMDDRYRNLRGTAHYESDRETARIHLADIIDILSVAPDIGAFGVSFRDQMAAEPAVRDRIRGITQEYFAGPDGPGVLLYEEFLQHRDDGPERGERNRAVLRASGLLAGLIVD